MLTLDIGRRLADNGRMYGAAVGVSEHAARGRSNSHLYHYAGNNPVRYVDPEGESPRTALKLISEHRNQIKKMASLFEVDEMGIASVIFQEKYHGIWADSKDALAFMKDRGVNDNTPKKRSYGLAEMQLSTAADLYGVDINENGIPKKMYDLLMDDDVSIAFIAAYIRKNEQILNTKLKGADAGAAHNLGAENYKKLKEGILSKEIDDRSKPIRTRSIEYQRAIKDALEGKINVAKDSKYDLD